MIKEKKITIKYYIDDKDYVSRITGDAHNSLYARVTYNRETTKFTIYRMDDDGELVNEFININKIKINSLTDLGESVYASIPKPYRNLEKVIRYEISKSPQNYSLKGLNRRLDNYSMSIRWATDRTRVLESIFKGFMNPHMMGALHGAIMSEAEFGYAEALSFIGFQIKDYQSQISPKLKKLIIGHILYRMVFYKKPYNKGIYELNENSCYDWIINSKVKKKFKKELMKTNILKNENFPNGYIKILKELEFSLDEIDSYISTLDNFIHFRSLTTIDNSESVDMIYFM